MPKATVQAASYDNAATYAVRLSRSLVVDGVPFSRRDEHEMVGSYLNHLIEKEGADAIARAERK